MDVTQRTEKKLSYAEGTVRYIRTLRMTNLRRHREKRSLKPEGSDGGRVENNVLYERMHEWEGIPRGG
jgi:hypothetical protein